jgi:TatD DNase family protein
MLVDSHCHLDAPEFDSDRDAVAARAFAAGVTAIVVPSVAPANFDAVADACRRYPGCLPAWGIHPLYVDRVDEGDLLRVRAQLEAHPAVAVGEIGLDFFVPDRDPVRQELFFVEQLKIARDLGLPVVLHIRRAQDAILKHLRRVGVCGGIAHAFNGSRQQAQEYLKLGFILGFGGGMTFTRASRIRELAASLPLDALALETDAPDIPPAFAEGGRNSPEYLPRIAQVLAELRGVSTEEVALATRNNVARVLPGMKIASGRRE